MCESAAKDTFTGFQEFDVKRYYYFRLPPVVQEINEREADSSGELAKGRITTTTTTTSLNLNQKYFLCGVEWNIFQASSFS
jgi:hypothetical protein